MKKLTIIFILFCISANVKSQQKVLSPNAEIITVSKPALPDGFYWVDDSTMAIRDAGISLNKINIKFGASLSLVNGVLNIIPQAASGTQVTDYRLATVPTAGINLQFGFPNIPADYSAYTIFRNRLPLNPVSEYSASGNVITILVRCDAGDILRYQRFK